MADSFDRLKAALADRYAIQEELGAGGMATVYLAEDLKHHRKVAVKVLRPELAAVLGAERFLQEITTTANLQHPHILPLFDSGEADGFLYYVMPFIDGETVRDKLNRETQLGIDEAVKITTEVADALDYAHRNNVIHRDIKPENILLEEGHAVVADFGIALAVSEAGAERLTGTGLAIGTPAYMSPEQATGAKDIDARSDIYSLGCVLYEMLAGEPPYAGPSAQAILARKLVEPLPRLRVVREAVPETVETAVSKALAKTAADRFATAAGFGKALLRTGPVVSAREAAAYLPADTTPFIGRDVELAAMGSLLSDASVRVVSIVGPGGMGKTRLALAAGHAQLDAFPDGACFVPLTGLKSGHMLAPTVAEHLRFRFYGEGDEKRLLLDHLRDKALLLILDGFDELPEGASFVTEMLEAAPGVKLIVTSRERLNLTGEAVLSLSGMLDEDVSPEDNAAQSGACDLFLETARRIRANVRISDAELPDVVRICRLVGGMPLAIELAGTWSDVLSAGEIAEEIKKSLDFLQSPARGGLGLQQSVRAVFEQSWRQLNDEQQRVFTALSIFRGGFTRAAAERVAGASVATLTSLLNKSMIYRTSVGRYGTHEILRQFAAEGLAQPRDLAVRASHAAYFADRVSQLESRLRGGAEQPAALAEFDHDLGNVRQAWDSAVTQAWAPEIRKLQGGLYYYYDVRSLVTEAKQAFATGAAALEALTATRDQTSEELRVLLGTLLARQGHFACRLGQLTEATNLLYRSLEELMATEVRDQLAFTLNQLGELAWASGKLKEAKQFCAKSMDIFRSVDDRWGMAACLTNLGVVAYALGDYQDAEQWHRDSLALSRELDDHYTAAFSSTNLGVVLHDLGRHAEAAELHQQSLTITRELEDTPGIATASVNLGRAHYAMGAYDKARILYLDALDLYQELGDRPGQAAALTNLGDVAASGNDFAVARRYYEKALRLGREVQAAPLVAETLTAMAALAAKQGEKAQALQLLVAILDCSRLDRETKERRDKLVEELESELSSSTVKAIRQSQSGKTKEEAVDELLAARSW